jgi:hypothetical protein
MTSFSPPVKTPARTLPIPTAPYKGDELKRVAARPGALDPYKIPSRGLKC